MSIKCLINVRFEENHWNDPHYWMNAKMSEKVKDYYKQIQNYFKLKEKEFDKQKNIEIKRKEVISKIKDLANTLEDLEKKMLDKQKLDKKAESGSEKDKNKVVKKNEEIYSIKNKISKIEEEITSKEHDLEKLGMELQGIKQDRDEALTTSNKIKPKGVFELQLNVKRPVQEKDKDKLSKKAINVSKAINELKQIMNTVAGLDEEPSEWKYIPIRRLVLFLEESLYRNTKWVVFEPNDEPTWASIRSRIGEFMLGLFNTGIFQGISPKEAFFVKCDSETTTEADKENGIVNIEVGFAPLKPAEFIIIKIQQYQEQ